MFEIYKRVHARFGDSVAQFAKRNYGIDAIASLTQNYKGAQLANIHLELPEGGSELEKKLREIVAEQKGMKSIQSLLFKHTLETQLSKRIPALIELNLDVPFIHQIALMMSTQDSETLYWESIVSSPTLDRSLQILEGVPSYVREKHIPFFMDILPSLNPSVEKINCLIRCATTTALKEKVILRVLPYLSTRQQLKALQKPSLTKSSAEYKDAIKQFKKNHPKPARKFFLPLIRRKQVAQSTE